MSIPQRRIIEVVKNTEIAKIFQDIADLLELKGELQFKVRAYQRAARAIESLPVPIEKLLEEGKLRDIPGIGEAMEKKIKEIVETGRLEYYERLKSEFPEGITRLMDIPGVGPKLALRFVKELGITTPEELERAILDGKVAKLPRLGEKTAQNILKNIRSMRSKEKRFLLGKALPLVRGIIKNLEEVPGVKSLVPVGSLRRFKETVGDIDIMATSEKPKELIEAFSELPFIDEILAKGTTKASAIIDGIQVDLRVVEPDSFGSLIQYFTGSKDHNIALRERGIKQGLKLSEYGITDLKTGNLEKFPTEEGFYARLGLQYIPPELREGRGEIEKAERWEIPELLKLEDIRGDLHIHTKWSDGRDSIEEIALEAKRRGYEYIAITDHSAGRGIAKGLDAERLLKQVEEIKYLNSKNLGIRILSGIEVDIRADGSLDLPDEVLSRLDIVIAAVHSAMKQDESTMTRRVIKALENPYVKVLAHPTCRLLGEREPVNIDMEEVFKTCKRLGKFLEINAMPDRLDLRDIHIMRAKEYGIKLVIGTDAHSREHLDFMLFGVGTARRGWAVKEDILNTLPYEKLIEILKGGND